MKKKTKKKQFLNVHNVHKKKQFIIYKCPYCPYKNVYASLGSKQYCLSESPVVLGAEGTGTSTLYNFHGIEVNFASMTCKSSSSNKTRKPSSGSLSQSEHCFPSSVTQSSILNPNGLELYVSGQDVDILFASS